MTDREALRLAQTPPVTQHPVRDTNGLMVGIVEVSHMQARWECAERCEAEGWAGGRLSAELAMRAHARTHENEGAA